MRRILVGEIKRFHPWPTRGKLRLARDSIFMASRFTLSEKTRDFAGCCVRLNTARNDVGLPQCLRKCVAIDFVARRGRYLRGDFAKGDSALAYSQTVITEYELKMNSLCETTSDVS
jgi:hypothetical protein